MCCGPRHEPHGRVTSPRTQGRSPEVMWFVVAAAIGGGVVGAFLPALVRTVPDRQPYPDDPDPAPRPHREIGSIPRLAWYTAPTLALVWAAVVFTRFGHPADMAAYLVVTALWVAAAVVDLIDQRLPDLLTLPAAGTGALLLAVAALVTGQWGDLGRAALGVLALGARSEERRVGKEGRCGWWSCAQQRRLRG